ncbi:protein kinase family protein [Rhynchospora pubera]|uniref:mitogen-activated protein kinase kinase kinase n=1 Tax=Rhynchospora pubera TaxID=906938 RepID=A0AAV8FLE0_9POAL|nr:protein kinase family protein [Rhynchospora pubera]
MEGKQSASPMGRRLERINAIRNAEYKAEAAPPGFEINLGRGSFRIRGGSDREIELLCSSLGLSGPDDFAIQPSVWAAAVKSSRFDLSPAPHHIHSSSTLHQSPEKQAETTTAVYELREEERFVEETQVVSVLPLPPGRLKVSAPPPSLRLPPIERAGSSWEILDSFGPPEEEDDLDKFTIRKEEEDAQQGLRSGETINSHAESISKKVDETVGSRRNSREERGDVIDISPHGSLKRTISSWMKGDMLGSGSFGAVYEAIDHDGFFFAVKEIFIDQGSNAKQSLLQLEQEVSLLSRLQHENIVQYYGTDRRDGKLYIFLELVTQGSLASLYRRYRFQDSQVSAYTRQILNGLSYLHHRNILHRDIKCANILVDAHGCVKLADFGLAKEIDLLIQAKSCKGTVYWMAPEVVKATPHGPPADIWSLGCTVLEMLTGHLPYHEIEWTQAMFKIGRGERPQIPGTLSNDARDFIDKCLQVNPRDRPSAAALLQHPFVRPRSSDEEN